MVNYLATWIPCPGLCDEYWCRLHDMHVHDCDCPSFEDLIPVNPYEAPPDEVADRIAEVGEFIEE